MVEIHIFAPERYTQENKLLVEADLSIPMRPRFIIHCDLGGPCSALSAEDVASLARQLAVVDCTP